LSHASSPWSARAALVRAPLDRRLVLAAVAVLMALPWAAGCGAGGGRDEAQRSESPRQADAHAASGKSRAARRDRSDSGRELLHKAMKAYSEAASYADAGQLRVRATQNGLTDQSDAMPFSTSFARPNKLRFHSLGATAVCDGDRFWGVVVARDGQVLSLPAPATLSDAQVYAEPTFAYCAAGDLNLRPPQLEWLLSPVAPQLPADAEVTQLGDDKLPQEETPCHRVEVTVDDDPAVYWLDAETNLLRRYEFPSHRIAAALAANQPDLKVKAWADFPAARLNVKLPSEAFAFEPPATARLVNHFVDSPPQPPSPLLGKSPNRYSFVDLHGNTVASDSLEGKVVVLDMWATWCGWCLRSMPNLEKVYQAYQDNPRVAILAVSNDAADVPDERVGAALADLQIHVPIVRDRSELAKSLFQVSVWPTMIVVGPSGVVEQIELGYQANLAETLPKRIDALLAGQSLYAEELARYQRAKRRHDEEMAAAQVAMTRELEIPQVDVAPASEPENLQRSTLWTTADVKTPGNLLVVPGPEGGRRLLAIEASRDVVELSPDNGAVTSRHELNLPPDGAISFVRTAVDGSGKRFYLAFASAGQQLFVFDADWRLVGPYPAAGKQAGLADAALVDLDGDGQLELAASYWGPVGVQLASLDGKPLQANRALENIMRVVAVGPGADGKSRLLCAGGGQALNWLNPELAPTGEAPTPNRAVYNLLPRIEEGETRAFAALSSVEVGATVALGLGPDGTEKWSYELPRGVARYPVEAIALVSLRAGSEPAWLFPGADGSLHFVAADGRAVDRFNYGRQVTGVVGIEIGGEPALVVATPDEITAWRILAGEKCPRDTK